MKGKDADTVFAGDKETSNQASYCSSLAVWGASGQGREGSVAFFSSWLIHCSACNSPAQPSPRWYQRKHELPALCLHVRGTTRPPGTQSSQQLVECERNSRAGEDMGGAQATSLSSLL